jgi:hypothetical protein
MNLNVIRASIAQSVMSTGNGLDGREVGVGVLVATRLSSTSFGPALGPTQPPIQWVPGVKRPGREADQ